MNDPSNSRSQSFARLVPLYNRAASTTDRRTLEASVDRVYDSTLSRPGHICRTAFCRSFVAGGESRCKQCGALV